LILSEILILFGVQGDRATVRPVLRLAVLLGTAAAVAACAVLLRGRIAPRDDEAGDPQARVFEPIATVAGCPVCRDAASGAVVFTAGMAICADGAPDAYHPQHRGTDQLKHAGRPGCWWALATTTGKPDGTPVVQGKDNPMPGFYVSTTALFDRRFRLSDPRRYVNANVIPYIVLPHGRAFGARLGDYAYVINTANGRECAALYADVGPKNKLGEGSVALALALGVPANPRVGGVARGIAYVVFPGSGTGKPQPPGTIRKEGARLFAAFGGRRALGDALAPPGKE
jgi:hypothetical protein